MFNSSGPPSEEAQLVPLVTAVSLGLLAAMGVVGNVFVLAAVAHMPQMHHITYILVSNLSAVGLLICVLTIPVHMVQLLAGSGLWEGRSQVGCKALAHVNFGLVLCMLVNSAAIALCRYRTVTAKHSTRQHPMAPVRILRLILFIWALPTLGTISASPFLGLNTELWECFFLDLDNAFWYMNMALAAPAVVSTVCMFSANVLIIKKVRDSRIKVSNLCSKPIGSATDNAVSEGREGKSESEHMKDVVVQNPCMAGDPGPSSPVAVRIFTTMIPDEHLNILATSYNTNDDTPPSGFGHPGIPEDTQRPLAGTGSSQSPSCLLQLPPLNPSTELGVLAVTSSKSVDNLSVPSRSTLSLYQDGVSTVRDDSVLSGSSCSVTQHNTDSRANRHFRREVKLSVQLFLAFVLFCLLYLPVCFVHVLHALHGVGREVWLILYTLALSFASNAWLVYALLNNDFRRAFRALLQGRQSF